MSWVNAIKKYSELTGEKFAIPKRDSPEYAKIKTIQERMAKGEEIAAVPRAKPAKKKVAAPAPVAAPAAAPAPAPAPVPAPVKKAVVVKKENVEEAPPTYPIEIKKVKVRVMKAKPAEPVPEPIPEPVKEVKKPRAPKAPKKENVEEPAKEYAPEVKVVPQAVKEARQAKADAKNARLEEQAKKQSELNVKKLKDRLTISREPVVLDFS